MYIPRTIRARFDKIFAHYNMIALVGARQAGKTTFLINRMADGNTSYVLFDDPDARALFEEDIKKFEMQYIEGHELAVLDEVQYCKDAGRNLKYLIDTGRRLWITSSSEVVLGKEILSYLVGRVSIIRLYPFSFREFLDAKGHKSLTPSIIERSAWEHITYGGYPKVVITRDPAMKKTILRDLYETMLLKDVAMTFSIRDIRTLEVCVKYLAATVGGLLTYDHLSDELDISFQTAKKYLDALEKSYLIRLVPPFHTNKRKEITKQPKIYFVDTGLRNSIVKRFDIEPDGRLFENYIFTELEKLGLSPKYWRTKSGVEVDFVIENGASLIPIEVKLRARPPKVGRSLRSFIQTYEPEMAVIVTYKGIKGETQINNCRAIYTDIIGLIEILNDSSLDNIVSG